MWRKISSHQADQKAPLKLFVLLALKSIITSAAQYEVISIAVKLKQANLSQAMDLARSLHVHYDGKIGELDAYYLYSLDNSSSEPPEPRLTVDDRIEWFEVQRREERGHRIAVPDDADNETSTISSGTGEFERFRRAALLFNDPYYSRQWYLNKEGHSIGASKAWAAGYTGHGVVVSIVDDGLQKNHPDIHDNFDSRASLDVVSKWSGDSDPTPRRGQLDGHGTRCASLVASKANNQRCTVGVAYNANIGGIRLLNGPTTDAEEARAFGHAQQYIDIYSASWGPMDDGQTFKGPGPLLQRTLRQGTQTGRSGRGNIFVWATGNGHRSGDSCSFDGYITNPNVVPVAAVDYDHVKPSYLEMCPAILCTAYSYTTGSNKPRIHSAEIGGGCAARHSGTSVSAPLVAGVIALVLQANPRLNWRDVQHILIGTSRSEPLRFQQNRRYWKRNGVGRYVSDAFGYGVVDASKAVQLAKRWRSVGEQQKCSIDFSISKKDQKLTYNSRFMVKLTVAEKSNCTVRYLEHVQLIIDVPNIDRRGALQLTLISPMGTTTVMMPARPLDTFDGSITPYSVRWPFLSRQQWGEKATGEWTLMLSNQPLNGHKFTRGTIRNVELRLFGTVQPPMNTRRHHNH